MSVMRSSCLRSKSRILRLSNVLYLYRQSLKVFSPWSWRTNCSPRLFATRSFFWFSFEGLKSSTGVLRMVLCKAFQSSFYGQNWGCARAARKVWRQGQNAARFTVCRDKKLSDDLKNNPKRNVSELIEILIGLEEWRGGNYKTGKIWIWNKLATKLNWFLDFGLIFMSSSHHRLHIAWLRKGKIQPWTGLIF